jgi:5-(hydroxymethyl)furfural/furfural oxidase
MAGPNECDILIVGGGPAGCVLANRLSASPDRRVFLIEAGEDYAPGHEPDEICDPYYRAVYHTAHLWPGARVHWPQVSDDGGAPAPQPLPYAQARVIGGGSSVNAMMAVRGLAGDFDEWEAAGVNGWSWQDVLPYFRKLETDREFADPAVHGQNGPLPILRISREDWPPVAVAAGRALARDGHTFIDDLNAAPQDGYARVTLNNLSDRRVSGATAYLTAEVRARDNLRIVSRTRATHVLFDGRRAVGIAAKGSGGDTIFHSQTVILSAGALQTPALLQRSGVGPAAALGALGISVIADNPGVGNGLQDHPTAGVGMVMRSDSLQDPALRPNGNLVLRLSSGNLSPEHADAPAHDIFMPVYNKTTWHTLGSRLGLVQAVLYGPHSRGTVSLASPDPEVMPEVRFNLLSDPRDMARLKTAYRFAVALAKTPELAALTHGTFPAAMTERVRRLNLATRRNAALAAMASWLVDLSRVSRRAVLRYGLGTTVDVATLARDDALLEAWLTENARGFFHACCSCPMGADDDPMAALDSHCRVRGVDGLRVVDASVMPRITRASTNIQTMMIGERAADLILADL